MSGFVDRLDSRFYPNERGAWDNARYRLLFAPLIKPTDRVLDIGAGRGRISEMNLKGLAGHVTGADPDPCVKQNPYVDEAVVLTDPSMRLPFLESTFDVVITANVLEHVQNPVEMFGEVRRVLRPGGLFISKTPNNWHVADTVAGAKVREEGLVQHKAVYLALGILADGRSCAKSREGMRMHAYTSPRSSTGLGY